MSAVSVEKLEHNDWELLLTARQGKEGEAIWFGVLTGLRGAVTIWPNPRKKLFTSRSALLEFWEPVMRQLPDPGRVQGPMVPPSKRPPPSASPPDFFRGGGVREGTPLPPSVSGDRPPGASCNDPECGETSCNCSHAGCPCHPAATPAPAPEDAPEGQPEPS